MESMLGVGTAPFAIPPPLKVMSLKPMSSARIRTTFGGRAPAGGVAGPWAQVTGRFGSMCGTWVRAIISSTAS